MERKQREEEERKQQAEAALEVEWELREQGNSGSTNGGRRNEMEGGGHGRLGAMPWLLVKEDGMYLGVSLFFIIIIFLLMIFLGKEGRSAGPVPLTNGGV